MTFSLPEDRAAPAVDPARRFGGVARLYGPEGLRRLVAARVCVVGVGGVGSWAVEALARSGVGTLRLVDLDHVAESNINRQLPALDSTLGRAKVEVLAERIRDINPDCQVEPVEDFVTEDEPGAWLGGQLDGVLDCIDAFRPKAALIAHCRRARLALVSVGGAGGRRDPTRIKVGDLFRTEQDPLLARTRKQLRQRYGFPANPKRRFGVPVVWSDEAPIVGTDCETTRTGLNCGGLGSLMPVTATFGLVAAAKLLEKLASQPALSAALGPRP